MKIAKIKHIYCELFFPVKAAQKMWAKKNVGANNRRFIFIMLYFALFATKEYTKHPPNATNTTPTIRIFVF